MKNKSNLIENILLFLFIIICSYQIIFATINTFLDEFILIAIVMYEFLFHFVIKKEKIPAKNTFVFVVFIIITLSNVIFKQYNGFAYFEEIFNYLKLIILFEIFSLLKIDEKRYKKFMLLFIIVNLISMILGIMSYHFSSVIGYIEGSKFRNGKLRIAGLAGHPISLGFCSLFCIIYLVEKKKDSIMNKILSFLLILIFIYALLLTQDRLATMLLVMYLLIKTILVTLKKVRANVKKVVPFIVFIILGFCGIVFMIKSESINNYLKDDMEDTIRMFALQKSAEIFVDHPLLGTGIGTFGCRASIKYDSYVYNDYNFDRFKSLMYSSSGNIFESYLSKIIIETGIVGILFFAYFFFKYYKRAVINKNFFLFILLLCTNIYIILCNAYQIPFVIGMALTISYNEFKNKEEGLINE